MQKAQLTGPFDCCSSHQSVSGVTVSLLVSGLTVDILSTICGVFVVQFVKLMLRILDLAFYYLERLVGA